MSEKERILDLLNKYNLKAKKSFGQNFLINDGIINRIVKSLDVSSFDYVIEIGPGLGSLTNKIIEESENVIAVDADRDMISVLKDLYSSKSNLKLIQSDFLKYDPNLDTSSENRLFVGNLPYNITSELIEYFLKCDFKKMAIMVQKEVAFKLDYNQNKKDCSPLGAFLKTFCEYQFVTLVDRSCFYPQPKVDSAFISFDKRKDIEFNLYPIYKALFKDPNKVISNCLKQSSKYKDFVLTGNELLTYRARQLDVDSLYKLSKKIYNYFNK